MSKEAGPLLKEECRGQGGSNNVVPGAHASKVVVVVVLALSSSVGGLRWRW